MDQSEIDSVVAEVLRGRRDLYRKIIEACETRVRLVLTTLLPDNASVEDVAQDTFVTAFTKLGEYRIGTDFVAWIGAVARNLAMNERRRWLRNHALLSRYRAQIEVDVSPRLEELSGRIAEDALPALRDCIGRLQDHARGIVEAFYFDDLASQEIAERYHRPPSWVFVILHRARVAIGQCLKAKGVFPREA